MEQKRTGKKKNKEHARLMQTVRLQTLFVLSLAFVNARVISQGMTNVGREARAKVGRVKMVLEKENKERVRLMRTVHLLTLFALSLDFVSASHTNREMLIAGKEAKVGKQEKRAQEKRGKTQQQKKKQEREEGKLDRVQRRQEQETKKVKQEKKKK